MKPLPFLGLPFPRGARWSGGTDSALAGDGVDPRMSIRVQDEAAGIGALRGLSSSEPPTAGVGVLPGLPNPPRRLPRPQVRIWEIPEGGLKRNMTEAVLELYGHSRRVGLVEWHPTTNNILFSAGYDYKVSSARPLPWQRHSLPLTGLRVTWVPPAQGPAAWNKVTHRVRSGRCLPSCKGHEDYFNCAQAAAAGQRWEEGGRLCR